jgi:hypothetical protein
MFCPFAMTGGGETGSQVIGDPKFVVDWRVKLALFVGQLKMMLAPAGVIIRRGGTSGAKFR